MMASIELAVAAAAGSIAVGLVVARSALGQARAHRVGARLLGHAAGGEVANEAMTAVPGVGPLLAPILRRAGVDASARTMVVAWSAVVGAATMLGLGLAGLVGAALGFGVGVVAPVGVLVAFRGRGDVLVERALPDALEAVGRSVRSGASLVQAIDESRSSISGPLVAELDVVLGSVRLGNPLAVALDDLVVRRPLVVVRLAAAALMFSSEAGGLRSQAIDGLAASLRDRVAVEREIHALASQTRFSAMIIAVLPVGFVLFSSATDPRVLTFLTGTALGRVCLVAGLGLDLVGMVWMRQLTGTVS